MSCPHVPVEDSKAAGFQPYRLHPLAPRRHLLPGQASPTFSHPDLPHPGVWFDPQQMTNILTVKWVCWEGAGPLEPSHTWGSAPASLATSLCVLLLNSHPLLSL